MTCNDVHDMLVHDMKWNDVHDMTYMKWRTWHDVHEMTYMTWNDVHDMPKKGMTYKTCFSGPLHQYRCTDVKMGALARAADTWTNANTAARCGWRMSLAYASVLSHVGLSHGTYEWVIGTRWWMNEWMHECSTCVHRKKGVNESCLAYASVLSHVGLSHVAYEMYDITHSYARHMHQSCHT